MASTPSPRCSALRNFDVELPIGKTGDFEFAALKNKTKNEEKRLGYPQSVVVPLKHVAGRPGEPEIYQLMSVKSSIGALRLSTKTIHAFPLLLIVKYHLACLDILLLANDVTRLHIKLEMENNKNSNKAFVLEKLLFPSSEKNTADSKTRNDFTASI